MKQDLCRSNHRRINPCLAIKRIAQCWNPILIPEYEKIIPLQGKLTMRGESQAFSSTISPSDLASFIVITVCECFPGRVRTILTSHGDKTDGKIRRCGRNKGECLETGVEWWTTRGRSSSPSLSLPLFPQIACSREESHTVFRWSRAQPNGTRETTTCPTRIYIYVGSRWIDVVLRTRGRVT